jgi:hypothetical protein
MIRLTIELTSDGVKAQVKLIPGKGTHAGHELSVQAYSGRTMILGPTYDDVLVAFAELLRGLGSTLEARAGRVSAASVQMLLDGGLYGAGGPLGPIEGLHDSLYDDRT